MSGICSTKCSLINGIHVQRQFPKPLGTTVNNLHIVNVEFAIVPHTILYQYRVLVNCINNSFLLFCFTAWDVCPTQAFSDAFAY